MTYQTAEPLERLSLSQTSRAWGDLVYQMDKGDLAHDLPYQRGDVWGDGQRILLIHSILSGTPIPALIVNRRPEDQWFAADGTRMPIYAVVDGKQRLITVSMFMTGSLPVPASWFRADDVLKTEATADGPYVRWAGLSRRAQRHTENMTVAVAQGSLASLREEAELYLRVNGAGTPQADEDMARAARVAAE